MSSLDVESVTCPRMRRKIKGAPLYNVCVLGSSCRVCVDWYFLWRRISVRKQSYATRILGRSIFRVQEYKNTLQFRSTRDS